MSDRIIEQNYNVKNRSKKPIIAAVSVICALLVIIICFLACKNSLWFAISQYKTEKRDYSEAFELIENIRTDKAEALSLYLALRKDINENYPVLLTDFQPSIIEKWTESVTEVENVKHFLSDEIADEAESLSSTLNQVNSCLKQYEERYSFAYGYFCGTEQTIY